MCLWLCGCVTCGCDVWLCVPYSRAHAGRTLQRKCLRAWAGWAGFKRELHLRVLALKKMHAHRRKATTFLLWRMVVERRCRLRAMVLLLKGRRNASLQARAFHGWRAVTARLAWGRRVSEAFCKEKLLARYFAALCRYVYERQRQQRLNQRAVAHWSGVGAWSLVSRRLQQWSAWAATEADLRRREHAFCCGKAFRAWLCYCHVNRDMTSALRRMCESTSLRLCRMAMITWRQRVEADKLAERAEAVGETHHRYRRLRHATRAWALWAMAHVQRRLASETVAARHRTRTLRAVLLAWQDVTHRSRLISAFTDRVCVLRKSQREQLFFDKWWMYVVMCALVAAGHPWLTVHRLCYVGMLSIGVGMWLPTTRHATTTEHERCAVQWLCGVHMPTTKSFTASTPPQLPPTVVALSNSVCSQPGSSVARHGSTRALPVPLRSCTYPLGHAHVCCQAKPVTCVRCVGSRHYERRNAIPAIRWWAVWATTTVRHRDIIDSTSFALPGVHTSCWR